MPRKKVQKPAVTRARARRQPSAAVDYDAVRSLLSPDVKKAVAAHFTAAVELDAQRQLAAIHGDVAGETTAARKLDEVETAAKNPESVAFPALEALNFSVKNWISFQRQEVENQQQRAAEVAKTIETAVSDLQGQTLDQVIASLDPGAKKTLLKALGGTKVPTQASLGGGRKTGPRKGSVRVTADMADQRVVEILKVVSDNPGLRGEQIAGQLGVTWSSYVTKNVRDRLGEFTNTKGQKRATTYEGLTAAGKGFLKTAG